jgi:Putative bacterial sensory transduction regulator
MGNEGKSKKVKVGDVICSGVAMRLHFCLFTFAFTSKVGAMNKRLIATVAIAIALVGQGFAQQTEPPQTPPPVARPAPQSSIIDLVRRYLLQLGATINEGKSEPDMVVTNYLDPKGGKITIVILNERTKKLLGFYIYNFGNLKEVSRREEIYKYLLSINERITLGSFFIDKDDDIGYKYRISTQQRISQTMFESIYYTMSVAVREHRPEIRRLLDKASSKEGKSEEKKNESQEQL